MAGAYPIGSIAGLIRISGAAQAQRDILGVQRSMTLTGESAGKAAAGIGKTETALGSVGTASTRAASGSAKYRAAQLSAVAASERYNAVLADQDASLARLASAEAGVIRANERMKASAIGVTGPIRSMGTQAEESAGLMARAGTALGGFTRTAAGLGVALGGFVLAKKALDVTRQASDFNAAMVRIQTQAGATAAEVKGFSGDVLGLAGRVAQAPDALALSLYHVYSATKTLGFTAPQMLNAVKVAGEGATASGADLEQTTNALTATMVSGLSSVNDMGKAMGALNAIVGAGDMQLSDLNAALGTGILAVAKTFGVSLEQAGAALAVFGDNNIRGAKAATTLRMVIQDLTKPASSAADVLGKVGLSVTSLRDDLQNGGLSLALQDLKAKLTAAGVTGSQVGGFIEDAFTKKAGVGLAMLLNNLDQYNQKQTQITRGAGGFGAAWDATTKTASFAFKRLGAQAEAEGIVLTQKLLPAAGRAAGAIAGGLVTAIHAAHDVLVPLGGAAHFLASSLEVVGHAAADVAHFLAPISPVLKFLATDVLATWAAFKGYQVARFAVQAVADGVDTLRARSVAGLASMRAYGAGVSATLAGNATEAQATSAIMQAEFAQVAAAAEAEAAVVAKAKAREAAAYADVVAASKAATDAQVTAAVEASAAAQAAAVAAVSAAEETAVAAEAAAASIDEAGTAAATGWSALLGPVAAVGIGIALLTSLFGDNSSAAVDETQNIQDLTSALEQDSSAVGANTKSWIAHKLATSGILDQQQALGLSYETITQAARGNVSALKAVAAAGRAAFSSGNFKAADAANQIIGLAGAMDVAKRHAREQDAAQVAANQSQRDGAKAASRNADALGNLQAGSHAAAAGAKANASATAGETETVKQAAAANKKYVQTLHDELLAIEAVIQAKLGEAQTQDQFLEGLRAMDKQLNGNNGTLSQNTSKGLANRDALLTQIGAAVSLKDAEDKAGGSVAEHTRKLASNIAEIRAHAIAAGADKGQVDALIRSLHAVPAHIRSQVVLDTGPARSTLAALMNQINSLHPTIHVGITGGSTTPGHYIPPNYSGGGLPEGVSSLGERGPELAIKNGPNVQILSNSQSHKFLAATGMRAPGFADGTSPSPITTGTSGGHKVWIYNGIQYASLMAAQNAETRAQNATGPVGARATLNPVSLLRALSGTAASERSAFAGLLNIARRAGVSGAIADALGKENKQLDQAIKDRNHLDNLVDKANARLVADEKKRAAELKAVKSAITGSFDVTTAGTGFDGSQPVTGGSMLAQEKQAALRARTFVSDIKKLSGKVGNAYLYQLAEKGPDALPEVQALLSLSPKQLRGFRADEQSLGQSGQSLGQFIGRRRYGGAITDDRNRLQLIRHADDAAGRLVKQLGDHIVNQLEHAVEHLSNPKINIYLPNGKQLATVVKSGSNHNGRKN